MSEPIDAFLSDNIGDFDVNQLTKPQIRSLLSELGATALPPSSAKKDHLVHVFNEQVLPRRNQLRRERGRVRPSASGIIFLDEESHPSPVKSPPKSTHRSSSTKTDRRSSSRSPLSRKTRTAVASRPASSPERGASPRRPDKTRTAASKATTKRSKSARRQSPRSTSRPRRPPPHEKREDDDAVVCIVSDSSPVQRLQSAVNVSPLVALQKALPGYLDSPRAATAKLHSRLERIAADSQVRRLQAPSADLVRSLNTDTSKPVPSGYPTVAVGAAAAAASSRDRIIRTIRQSLGALSRLFCCIALAISVGLYIRWKFVYPFPYCDSGQTKSILLPPQHSLATMAASIQEYCLPCPRHGQCQRGRLVCIDGFVPVNRLIRFGARCDPDRQKLNMIEDVVTKIKRFVSEEAGRAICTQQHRSRHQLTNGEPTARFVTGDKVIEHLRSFTTADWNGPKFDAYYRLALNEIIKDGSTLTVSIVERNGHMYFESLAPAIPLGCRLYLYFADLLYRVRYYFFGIGIVFFTSALLWFRIQAEANLKKRVDELVQAVLQILAEQDALNRRDSTVPSTLSVHQLRDALFLKASSKEKHRLWPKVCQAINRNSNVRESVMSIKGEQHRVWEWIGSDILSPYKVKAEYLGRSTSSERPLADPRRLYPF